MNDKPLELAVTSLGPGSSEPSSGIAQKVLFIHGFGADKQGWAGNAPALFDVAETLAVDLPGHGVSVSVETTGDLQSIADQVLHCLNLSGHAPCHIVGHSLGAAVALLCTAAKPDYVLSLSLIAPAGLGGGVNTEFTSSFVALDNEKTAFELLQTLVSNPRLIARPLAGLLLANLDKPGARQALDKIANGLNDSKPLVGSAMKQVLKKGVRCQVIWGLQDIINPPLKSDEADFGGNWIWLDDCGHLPHVEHRAVVNDAILKFLNV